MYSAKIFFALSAIVGAVYANPPIPINALGIPIGAGWVANAGPLSSVAVAPAGLTISAAAQAAADQQLRYQIAQAQRASIVNAINQAQQANSIANQANNARHRDSLLQANAERVLAAGNLAQASRDGLSQAQNAQVQIALSNAAAARNIAILTANSQAFLDALGADPILVSGAPAISSVPTVAQGKLPALANKEKARGSVNKEAEKDQIAVEAPAVDSKVAASPLSVGAGSGRKGPRKGSLKRKP